VNNSDSSHRLEVRVYHSLEFACCLRNEKYGLHGRVLLYSRSRKLWLKGARE
jgi:hypothetical protein